MIIPFMAESQSAYYPFANGCTWSVSDEIYMSGSDTLIDGKAYIKIYKVNGDFSLTENQFYVALRNDTAEKKVYALMPAGTLIIDQESYYFTDTNTEVLLYDFSINVGDTVSFYVIEPYQAINCLAKRVKTIDVQVGWSYNAPIIHQYSQEDSVISMVDGSHRYQFFLERVDPIYPPHPHVWIEGIGSVFGFREATQIQSSDAGRKVLLCFSDTNGLQFQSGYDFDNDPDDCFSSSFGEGVSSNNQIITVYPNPAHNSITVSSESPLHSITAYNQWGQQIFSVSPHGQSEWLINTTDWPAGLYLLRVNTETGINSIKVVITKNL